MTADTGFRRNLFLASPLLRGEDVFALQNGLVRNGASITRDGLFGLATQKAVRSFQGQNGLVQDGVAGPATWSALFDRDDDGAPFAAGGAALPRAGSDVPRRCFEVLRGHNFTAEQACGIIANVDRESGFNPAALGDGLKAYGLGQWHPDRQGAFRTKFSKPIVGSSIDDQLAFIHFEMMEGREQRAGEKLQAARTAREAGEIVSRFYERPAAADAEAQLRGAKADTYFHRFTAAAGTPVPRLAKSPALPFRMATDLLGGEQVQDLLGPHRLFHDSMEWSLTDHGIAVADAPAAAATPADRDLVLRMFEEQGRTLVSILGNGQVPIELVLAALCAARPLAGAVRIGPGGDLTDNNRTPDCISAGSMQARLSMARIALNRPDLSVEELRQPDTAIRAGAAVMWLHAAETRFDPPLVAAMYVVGTLRHNARSRWKLLEYATIAPDYVDRFVRFFDAAMQTVDAASLPPQVSSFHRLIELPVGPVATSGHGPYVARNPRAYIKGSRVADGQCARLVQVATGAPHTTEWRQGEQVQGNAAVRPGTAIATFDDDGQYHNHTDGRSHAALYLGEVDEGIQVVDQWVTHNPDERTIHFRNDGAQKADRGECFFVVR